MTGHTGVVTGVTAFTAPDGQLLLATTSRDKTVQVWDPIQARALLAMGLAETVTGLGWLGADLVVGLHDGWARIALPRLAPTDPLGNTATS